MSLHIRQLEEELGTRLFTRSTRQLRLTERGREIYEHADSILTIKERMEEICGPGRRQIIRLGASTIPSAYILPEILPDYAKEHPDTYFVIDQGDSGEICGKLLSGVIDIALVGMDPGKDGLIVNPFYKDRVVVITPVNEHFLDLKEKNAPLKELMKEPVILREEGSGSRKAAEGFLKAAGVDEKDLRISARINDPEAIKNLVAGGLGISIISEKAAENYRREKRLLVFSYPGKGSTRSLYTAVKKSALLPPFVRSFLKYLKNYYK